MMRTISIFLTFESSSCFDPVTCRILERRRVRHRLGEFMQHCLFIIGVINERLRLDDRRRLIYDPPQTDMEVNFLDDNILELHREVLIVGVLQ